MSMSTVSIGRQGQMYVKEEATYGTVPSLTAAEACRHKEVTFPGSDVKNKRTIEEKQQSPFTLSGQRTDTRATAGFNLNAILRPSGTINTLPEVSPFLKAAIGSIVNTALSTTVASGGTVGGATLTSGTGGAVGASILITCPDGKKRARRITAINTGTGVTTWAPNLPTGQQPANAAAIKLGAMYKLTAGNLASLSIAHYLKNTDATAGLSRVLSGGIVDKLSLNFDANDDPMISVSGPGKLLDATTAPAQPGGFTMVGSQPPSGITGEFLYGNTAAKILKMGIDLTTGMKVRNESYGYSSAEEAYRAGRAEIACSLDLRAESQTLYDLTVAGTNTGLFLQTGFTEGNIIALWMPAVELQVPDTDDPDDEVNFPYKGMALESSDGALDALYLGLL